MRLFLLLVSFSAVAAPPRVNYPPGGFQDNFWQGVQLQHLQTQQQLQSQDLYRRQLLQQDQQRQLQQAIDQQDQLEYQQRNSTMRQHSDLLKLYSQPIKTNPKAAKNKQGR
jgi:hypothetical protein